MKFKYVTGNYGLLPIVKKEITRETDNSVWYMIKSMSGKEVEQRSLKRSSWKNYFDTFEEAKQFLIEESMGKLSSLQERLNNEQLNLAKLHELSEAVDD